MEKDCKSTPQDTVDDGSTVVGGGFERFESSKSSSGYQSEQEGGSDQREKPFEPFRTVQNPSEPTASLEERVRRDCRRECRRNLFVELLKTVAKVAGVILAAMGLSSFNEED